VLVSDPPGLTPLDAPAMCLSAVSGSATLLPFRRKRSQRASWISGHLALVPGAGRLHVNVGWRHPRPAAANGAHIVSGSHGAPGIRTLANDRGCLSSSLTRG
jgi:hypothetical protein